MSQDKFGASLLVGDRVVAGPNEWRGIVTAFSSHPDGEDRVTISIDPGQTFVLGMAVYRASQCVAIHS